jgi:hypothetical protein
MTASAGDRPFQRHSFARCISCKGLHLADLWHDIVTGAHQISTHTICPRCGGGLRIAPTSAARRQAG